MIVRTDMDAATPLAVAAILLVLVALAQRARAPSRVAEQIHGELQLNERRYRSLVQATSAIVWRTAPSGQFVSAQPEWSRFTGQGHDEMMGWGWIKAVHPDDRDRTMMTWTLAIAKHTQYQIEHRLRTADGTYRHMSGRAVPIMGSAGEVIEWVGAHIDITEQRRAQRELARGEQHLQRVLNSLFTFVGVLTPDGVMISSNEAPLRAAGIRAEDAIGKPFWDCYWWNWSTSVQEQLKEGIRRAAAGESPRYDVKARMAGGTLMTLDFMISPMRDEDGLITHLIPSAVDVSDRKRAENALAEREQFYRHLIEAIPLLIWTCLPDGTFDYICDRWQTYAGAYAGLRRSFADLTFVYPDDRETASAAWEAACRSGEIFSTEMRLRRHDGTYRWFASYATPWRRADGQIVKWCGTSVDIDDRKRMEQALRDSETRLRTINSTLEQRVRERTAEVEARSEQLRALALDLAETESRERKRLAQVLHDHFQQLISAAKLKAGLLRRRLNNEGASTALREIESLLDETISASRSLSTQLSPPVLHDAGLVAALHWLARRMEQDHRIAVKLDIEGDCEPDNEQVRTLMFECVRELLFNVRKHANVNRAELKMRSLPEGLLQVQIIDHGKGFSPVTLERRTKADASFGLLSIRERLGLIGGLLTIESQPGKGTRVQISVPSIRKSARAAEALPEMPAMVPEMGTPRRLRVLVADDHSLFREGLVSLISQEPYAEVVGQAADGVEAIELARRLRPDVLIVDVSMPRLNGVQVTASVSRELPGTRIIGLSMHEQEDMAKSMRDAGAAAYCAKSGPAEETIVTLLRTAAAALTRQHEQSAASDARITSADRVSGAQ